MEPKTKKLGYSFRVIKDMPYPLWATQRILEDLPNIENELVDPCLQNLWEIQEKMTDLIKEGISLLKTKARKEGIAVKALPVCCHRVTCGVCLGKHPAHFPYLYIRSLGKENGYDNWRLVYTRDVRAFLSRFLDGEKVKELEILVWHREYFLTVYNYLALHLNLLGLIEKVV